MATASGSLNEASVSAKITIERINKNTAAVYSYLGGGQVFFAKFLEVHSVFETPFGRPPHWSFKESHAANN
jgi:hypothetical protein